MKIDWKKCDYSYEEVIENSMDYIDRRMLYMNNTSWNQVADDIEDCLKYAINGQFRNVVGFVEGEPAVFAMFGVECSGDALRIYNLLVAPKFRGKGVGKQAVKDITDERNIFDLNRTYSRVVTSVYSDNEKSYDMFTGLGLKFMEIEDNLINMERKL